MAKPITLALTALLMASCTTAPSGRSQLMMVSDSQMNQLGVTSFDQLKSDGKLANKPRELAYTRCIVDALVRELPSEWQSTAWEVQLFDDPSPNAFALPGGKVGVNTGMLTLATDQDQLAAVLGHEIAHVTFRHSGERVSQNIVAQTGLSVAGALASARTSPETARAVTSLLGAGAQVGVLLPFSRKHESEADIYGQELMARAGFNPQAAATLWQNMQRQAGGRPVGWLSTHPDPENRIRALSQRSASLMPVFQQARASGRRPACR